MNLALEFGMTERELLGRMDSVEYGKWKAYFRIFPFKEERADLRSALIATNIANSVPRSKGKSYKIVDFLFDFIKSVKKKTPEQMKSVIKMFTTVHNASRGK